MCSGFETTLRNSLAHNPYVSPTNSVLDNQWFGDGGEWSLFDVKRLAPTDISSLFIHRSTGYGTINNAQHNQRNRRFHARNRTTPIFIYLINGHRSEKSGAQLTELDHYHDKNQFYNNSIILKQHFIIIKFFHYLQIITILTNFCQ